MRIPIDYNKEYLNKTSFSSSNNNKFSFVEEKGLNVLIGPSGSGKTVKVFEEIKKINKYSVINNKTAYYTAETFCDKLVNSALSGFMEEFYYYLKYKHDHVFIDNVEYFLNRHRTRKDLILLAKQMRNKKNHMVLIATWDLSEKEVFFSKFFDLQ